VKPSPFLATLLMVGATLGWGMAGAVTRQLDQAKGFEVTFWRSAFTLISLLVLLTLWKGPRYWRQIRWNDRATWVSGACWSVMFTAFMLALTLTPTANVLVTLAAGPLLTALLSRLIWSQRQSRQTWWAIAVAGAGIVWMFGHELQTGHYTVIAGMLVALAVPVAAAVQWNVIGQSPSGDGLLNSVVLGAAGSCLMTWPLALPLEASVRDLQWLAVLGLFQLAVPCLLAVLAARTLRAAQMSLLSLLEVVFGIGLAWWLANETPTANVFTGGVLVLGALVVTSWLDLRSAPQAAQTTANN